MEPRKPTRLEQAIAVASALVMAWSVMPEYQRWEIRFRMLQLAHRATSKLAWREGHRAMGDELAGRELHRYPMAYRLSRLRDRIGAEIEGMRP